LETVRYTKIGKEDISFGTSTFEARLADGRVVLLSQVDLGALLSDAAISTRTVTLDTLTVTTLTVSGVSSATGTLQVPEKADPGSPVSGELWINSGGLVPEYADDAATPTRHAFVGDDTTQTLTNKTLTTPTITTPVLSGTATGTYVLGGTPSLGAALDAAGQDITALDELALSDAVANPTGSGRLRRNGADILWNDGTSSKIIVLRDGTQTLTNKTLSDAVVANAAPATPTANVLYADSLVKGWVVFQMDGTISDDVNVSSVTDNAAGDWTVNWATAFANANYAVNVTMQGNTGAATSTFVGTVSGATPPTTTACTVLSLAMSGGFQITSDPLGGTLRTHVLAIGNQ